MTDAERILNELILNVGKVTAYADAVAGGYTGTREEWEEALAGIGSEAAAALAAKNAAEAAQTAAETAQSAAETAAGAAGTAASSAADDASDAHIDALAATAAKEAAETAQLLADDAKASANAAKGAAETAQGKAEDAQEAAEAAQTAAETAQAAAETAETNAETAQTGAETAQAAAEAVLESIPEDYSAMSADVTDLKSATEDLTGEVMVVSNPLDWGALGTESIPIGWRQGYWGTSDGEPSYSGNYIRTASVKYKPADNVEYFVITAPEGYCLSCVEFIDPNVYVRGYGNPNPESENAATWLKIPHTVGHVYTFSVGKFTSTSDVTAHLTAEFVATIVLKTYRKNIDDTLTVSHSAADAKTVGDKIDATDIFGESEAYDWHDMGMVARSLGWVQGYYAQADGAYTDSTSYICTSTNKYMPDDSVTHFTITAPEGKAVAAFEFDENGYIERHGNMNSANAGATQSVTVEHTPGHYYTFCVGRWDSGSYNYITEGFLSTVVLRSYTASTRDLPGMIADRQRKNHLNILIFGNSYSADSWSFVPYMLKKYGITCRIVMYYRGSGSVDRLVAEWEDTGDNGTDAFGRSHIRRAIDIDSRKALRWNPSVKGKSAKNLLELANDPDWGIDKWDLIVLNQGSRQQSFTVAPGGSDPRKGTEPYLRQAINLINESYTKPYTLAWFGDYTSCDGYAGSQSQGYPPITPQEMDNRVGVLKSTETIMMAEPFDMIIPAGTAVFNARTNADLASTDLSAVGNLWCPDRIHLHAGIPDYIANCVVVQSIFNKFFPGLSVLNDDTRITDQFISDYHCPFIANWCGSVMSDDETLYQLGQKAAIMACKYPYDITPIYLPEDTTALELFDTHQDRYWADAMISTPA